MKQITEKQARELWEKNKDEQEIWVEIIECGCEDECPDPKNVCKTTIDCSDGFQDDMPSYWVDEDHELKSLCIYHCKYCGSDKKYVQQLFDDEVIIDENGIEDYIGLADEFENTGIETCVECHKNWTGDESKGVR